MPGQRSAMRNGKRVSGNIGNGVAPSKGTKLRGSKATPILQGKYSTAIKIGQLAHADVTLSELRSVGAPKQITDAYEAHLKRLLKK